MGRDAAGFLEPCAKHSIRQTEPHHVSCPYTLKWLVPTTACTEDWPAELFVLIRSEGCCMCILCLGQLGHPGRLMLPGSNVACLFRVQPKDQTRYLKPDRVQGQEG